MYERKILQFFSLKQLNALSKFLHTYFPLVSANRIKDLILQVDSLDVSLHLLNIHLISDITLDTIIYEYLHYKDNKSN